MFNLGDVGLFPLFWGWKCACAEMCNKEWRIGGDRERRVICVCVCNVLVISRVDE